MSLKRTESVERRCGRVVDSSTAADEVTECFSALGKIGQGGESFSSLSFSFITTVIRTHDQPNRSTFSSEKTFS